jgi:hypothetical protein
MSGNFGLIMGGEIFRFNANAALVRALWLDLLPFVLQQVLEH